MFSFFSSPDSENDTHANAKSMAQYHQDLSAELQAVRAAIPQADDDPGFKTAAEVIEKVVILCANMETVSAYAANNINNVRSHLMRSIGPNGLIDVTGEASKLLAIKYNKLLQNVVDEKYWPVADCPSILGRSLRSEYDNTFASRKPRWENSIKSLADRITDYERSVTLKMRA